MKPILYGANTTNFNNNGIGILNDCISCFVTEERNGTFELEMEYPISGVHFRDIEDRTIIKADSRSGNPQLFRVYSTTKPMNGRVTIRARHISYDASGIPVNPFTATGVVAAMQGLKTNSAISCPFDFSTDKKTVGEFKLNVPASIRSCLGGVEGSILDLYGGEYEFDNFDIVLHNNRGMNRGVSIKYGKNLTSLEQERNCANVYTAILPYWYDSETNALKWSSPKIVPIGDFDYQKIKVVDFSADFEEVPTAAELKTAAENYAKNNNVGVPEVSLKITYEQLEQTEEYRNLSLLETVYLCDTVNVEFPALGVSATAKVVELKYNVLLGKVDSVTLGSVHEKITDTIAASQAAANKAQQTATVAQAAADNATNWLTDGKGYVVAVKDNTGAWSEILIMDTPDKETATKVWRWSGGGFGFSSTGYAGPYTTAITQDGKIVADFITTGILDATLLKAGVIQSTDGKTFVLDLESGVLTMESENGNFKIKADGTMECNGATFKSGKINLIAENTVRDVLAVENLDGSKKAYLNSYYVGFGDERLSSANSGIAVLGASKDVAILEMGAKGGKHPVYVSCEEDGVTFNVDGVDYTKKHSGNFAKMGDVVFANLFGASTDSMPQAPAGYEPTYRLSHPATISYNGNYYQGFVTVETSGTILPYYYTYGGTAQSPASGALCYTSMSWIVV